MAFITSILVLLLISYISLSNSTQAVPEFTIDFDIDPSIRYNEVFAHFKEPLQEMERLFYQTVPPQYRGFFKVNEEQFKQVNPHVYFAMESLANILEIETQQAILVNSIVDFYSFCTSIVARMENGTIIHARNLDFDYPETMNELVYLAKYVEGGVMVAEAPSLAGYIGAYTGMKKDKFTISYNVRELYEGTGYETNLEYELDGIHMPT